MKRVDEKELRLLEREPDPAELASREEMDAAVSCWDPWLIALARVEAAESAPAPRLD
jgi:hypothetical protein